MTPRDMAAIAAVHRAACLVAYRFMAWDHALPEIEAWYAGKFPGWDHARVATCNGRVVGYLGAAGGLLDDLFVDPAFHRRGIGRTCCMASSTGCRDSRCASASSVWRRLGMSTRHP